MCHLSPLAEQRAASSQQRATSSALHALLQLSPQPVLLSAFSCAHHLFPWPRHEGQSANGAGCPDALMAAAPHATVSWTRPLPGQADPYSAAPSPPPRLPSPRSLATHGSPRPPQAATVRPAARHDTARSTRSGLVRFVHVRAVCHEKLAQLEVVLAHRQYERGITVLRGQRGAAERPRR